MIKIKDDVLVDLTNVYIVFDVKCNRKTQNPIFKYKIAILNTKKERVAYYITSKKITRDVRTKQDALEELLSYEDYNLNDLDEDMKDLEDRIDGKITFSFNEFLNEDWIRDNLAIKNMIVKKQIGDRKKVSISLLKSFEKMYNAQTDKIKEDIFE